MNCIGGDEREGGREEGRGRANAPFLSLSLQLDELMQLFTASTAVPFPQKPFRLPALVPEFVKSLQQLLCACVSALQS